MMEFFFDTTRACVSMMLTGTFSRYRDIRFIIPHMGGAFQTVIDRVAGFSSGFLKGKPGIPSVDEIYEIVKDQLWFDTAGVKPVQKLSAGLLQWARKDHICYGSDASWTPPAMLEHMAHDFEVGTKEIWGPDGQEALEGVHFRNAEKLFSRR